jgi:hypothetical protein
MTDTTEARSGRFVLRMEPDLHQSLRRAAQEAGVSLNEHCLHKLRAPIRQLEASLAGTVEQASAAVGNALQAVILFGSVAREEDTPASDIDVLIVVAEDVPITRSLYDAWDRVDARGSHVRVEPHFVQLPSADGPLSGFWAEIAVDGIILFERGLALSRYLAQVRRRILDGELVRRWAHGHSYWIGAA